MVVVVVVDVVVGGAAVVGGVVVGTVVVAWTVVVVAGGGGVAVVVVADTGRARVVVVAATVVVLEAVVVLVGPTTDASVAAVLVVESAFGPPGEVDPFDLGAVSDGAAPLVCGTEVTTVVSLGAASPRSGAVPWAAGGRSNGVACAAAGAAPLRVAAVSTPAVATPPSAFVAAVTRGAWPMNGRFDNQASGPSANCNRRNPMLRKARTTAGSNWPPEHRAISSRAALAGIGFL